MINNKGQSGAVFKLLIAATFASALLAIVYGYVQSIRPPITGIDAAESVLRSASDAPRECFSRDPVQFQEGQPYRGDMFQNMLGEEINTVTVHTDPHFVSDEKIIKYDAESSLSAECDGGSCDLYLGITDCDR